MNDQIAYFALKNPEKGMLINWLWYKYFVELHKTLINYIYL